MTLSTSWRIENSGSEVDITAGPGERRDFELTPRKGLDSLGRCVDIFTEFSLRGEDHGGFIKVKEIKADSDGLITDESQRTIRIKKIGTFVYGDTGLEFKSS